MNRKTTAIAPSNIAFIKYWGAKDLEKVVPANPSLSMTLSECVTRTTVELDVESSEHTVCLADAAGRLQAADEGFAGRVARHLEALRVRLGFEGAFRVATRNSFPSAAGIASSASGFAALATAVSTAVGFDPSPNELSDLARLGGSGSAARSLLGGFVQWPGPGADGEYDGPVEQVAPADHWELCDLVVVIDSGEKEVSSREGHSRAPTSAHYEKRQELLPSRLEEVRAAVLARDMARLGPAIEMEAVDLHLIAMSSSPPIFYWKPGTLEVLSRVRTLREQGVEVWATMDAGPNLHLICEPTSEDIVVDALASAGSVQRIIRDRVGTGPALVEDHLF